jgi:hypothetical protein
MPKDIIFIAQTKQLSIPEKLHRCFETQIKLEKEISQPIFPGEANSQNSTDKNLSVRERDNLLKAIGLFIAILFDMLKALKKSGFKPLVTLGKTLTTWKEAILSVGGALQRIMASQKGFIVR